MINVNNEIIIIPSKDLSDIRLDDLVGKTAIVVEIMCSGSRRARGYMVLLREGAYEGEYMWFVPEKSVCHV